MYGDFIAIVDVLGGISLVHGEGLAIFAIIPPRASAVSSLRWSYHGEGHLAITYRDLFYRSWNMTSLAVCSEGDEHERHSDETVNPPTGTYDVARSTTVFSARLFGQQALLWRPLASSHHQPIQVAILDVRRFIDLLYVQARKASGDHPVPPSHSVSGTARDTPGASSASRLAVAVRFIASLLFPWSCSAALDAMAIEGGLFPPSFQGHQDVPSALQAEGRNQIRVGIIGANGNVSFSFGAKSGSSCQWHVSGTLSSTLFIAFLSILNVPVHIDHRWDSLRRAFGAVVSEGAPPDATTVLAALLDRLPSFSFASKYWHDLSEPIQSASRLLIRQTLRFMPADVIASIVSYWYELLPLRDARSGPSQEGGGGNDGGDGGVTALTGSTVRVAPLGRHSPAPGGAAPAHLASQSGVAPRRMNRAAIILGVLALHRSECLDDRTRRAISNSLMGVLMDDKRNLFRSASIELVGRAFDVWREHIDALAVFRLFIGWLASLSQIEEIPHSAVPAGGGEGGGSLAAGSGGGVRLIVPFESAQSRDTVDAIQGALRRLILLDGARIVPKWLQVDLTTCKGLLDRWTAISVLANVISGHAARMAPFLLLAAECAWRAVDGSRSSSSAVGGVSSGAAGLISSATAIASSGGSTSAQLKQRLLSTTLPLISALTESYATVAFHRGSLRLVAASTEGSDVADNGIASPPARCSDQTVRVSLNKDGSVSCAVTALPQSAAHEHGSAQAGSEDADHHGGSRVGRIVLYDMRGGLSPRILEGHTQAVTALSFSPDGRILLSYSAGEATLRWWSLYTLPLIAFLSPTVLKAVRTDIVEAALTESVRARAGARITFTWSSSTLQPPLGGERVPPSDGGSGGTVSISVDNDVICNQIVVPAI